LPVGVDSKMKPFRLLLDSGVDHLVLKCGGRCGHLIEERTVKAVTNAGTSSVQAGRLPVAMVGSRRFFRMPTVVLDELSDPNNAEGSIPLNWFSAVYVNTAQSMIRFAR
jgi:hypothetical protein